MFVTNNFVFFISAKGHTFVQRVCDLQFYGYMANACTVRIGCVPFYFFSSFLHFVVFLRRLLSIFVLYFAGERILAKIILFFILSIVLVILAILLGSKMK